MIRAGRLGDRGYVTYLKALYRLGVLSHDELLVWLNLHGCVLRATEPPLDDGERLDEDAFLGLAGELGGGDE